MPSFELTDPPFERPKFISRDHLLGLLRGLCVKLLPEDLHSPMLDYLVGVQVVSREGDQYFLAANRDALFEQPSQARRALRRAMFEFVRSPQCPEILGYVFPGDGELRADSARQGKPDYAKIVARLQRSRANDIASLHELGTAVATRIVDHVIERQLRLANPSESTSSNVVPTEPNTSMRDDENQAAAASEQMHRQMADQTERFTSPMNLLHEKTGAVEHSDSWNPRDAFHRATMAVYTDLGALIEVLKRADLRVALLVLDEHATPGSSPDGDPEFVADLKHAAGRLRSSLATVQEIRRESGRAASAFGKGGSFGHISAVSHHDALAYAAEEVLEPDAEGAARSGRVARPQSESGALRRHVLKEAMDPEAWARLAENLKHGYELASLHPQPPMGESKPPAEAQEEGPPASVDGAPQSDPDIAQERRKPLPPIDWAARRAELVAQGDLEGAELLDRVVPRICNDPVAIDATAEDGGPPPPTDADVLNALQRRAQIRRLRGELEPALSIDATTRGGLCARWTALAAWVTRFARHTAEGRAVVDFGGFTGPVSVRQMYPDSGSSPSSELAWAEAFREATSRLVPLLLDEELDDVAAHRLLQDLDGVLDGTAVDLSGHVRDLDVLVRVLRGRNPEIPARSDAWQPTAHQELVLAVLARDGRLRTGDLWERIAPKHVNQRAHQNAMRDLVDHDKVLTAGKGQAIEYWLP